MFQSRNVISDNSWVSFCCGTQGFNNFLWQVFFILSHFSSVSSILKFSPQHFLVEKEKSSECLITDDFHDNYLRISTSDCWVLPFAEGRAQEGSEWFSANPAAPVSETLGAPGWVGRWNLLLELQLGFCSFSFVSLSFLLLNVVKSCLGWWK